MNKQFSTKSEQMLREMTLKRIKNNRSFYADKNLHVGGSYYKAATVISYITVIYCLIIFTAQLIGAYFKMLDYKIYDQQLYATAQNDFRNCLIISVILAVCIIALAMKKRLVFAVAGIVFTLFYLVNSTFAEVIIQKSEINRLIIFLPAIILMCTAAVYILAMNIWDYAEYKRAYSVLVDKIIATYPTADGEITTQAQWEEHIMQYSEPAVHAKPKKSLRSKKRKANQEVNDD